LRLLSSIYGSHLDRKLTVPQRPFSSMSISLAEQLPEYALYADVPPNYDLEKALKELNALTPEQKSKLGTGIAVAASSKEADQEFEKASTSAAIAVETIDTLFVTLTAKLISLGHDTQEFLETFTTLKNVSIYSIMRCITSLLPTVHRFSAPL
jgi:hypothetical protein